MQLLTRYLHTHHRKHPQRAKTVAMLVSRFVRHPDDALLGELINVLGAETVTRRYGHVTLSAATQRKLKAFSSSADLPPQKSFRIAVCISGDMRSFAHTHASIARFFAGHQVDYYCHGWEDDAEASLLHQLPNVFSFIESRPDLAKLEKQSIETLGLKLEKNGKKRVRLSLYVFPMWYGIKAAFGLIEKSGRSPDDYDLICRFRYDNFMLGQLAQMPELPSPDSIVIDPTYNGYDAYSDQFAIGRPSAMRKYVGLYDWLMPALGDYVDAKQVTAEILLRDWLDSEPRIQVDSIDFGLRLLRSEFVGLAPADVPLRSRCVSKARNDAQTEYVKKQYPELYSEH